MKLTREDVLKPPGWRFAIGDLVRNVGYGPGRGRAPGQLFRIVGHPQDYAHYPGESHKATRCYQLAEAGVPAANGFSTTAWWYEDELELVPEGVATRLDGVVKGVG